MGSEKTAPAAGESVARTRLIVQEHEEPSDGSGQVFCSFWVGQHLRCSTLAAATGPSEGSIWPPGRTQQQSMGAAATAAVIRMDSGFLTIGREHPIVVTVERAVKFNFGGRW